MLQLCSYNPPLRFLLPSERFQEQKDDNPAADNSNQEQEWQETYPARVVLAMCADYNGRVFINCNV